MIKINELIIDNLIYPKDQIKYTDYGFYKIRVIYLSVANRYHYKIFDGNWNTANVNVEICNMILPNIEFPSAENIYFSQCILPKKFYYMFDDRASFKNCIFK